MKRFRMKAYLLLTLLLTAYILPGCGGDAGNGHWDQPIVNPVVLSTAPAPAALGVPIGNNLTVTFNGEMDPATLASPATTFTVKEFVSNAPVSGVVTASGSTATFNPDADLLPLTEYAATVTTGAMNLAGQALASDYVWRFTTGATVDTSAPFVSATNISNGAVDQILNGDITATFNEAMDPATLASPATSFTVNEFVSNNPVSGVVTYLGNTATFNPDADLLPLTEYIATISADAKDLAGLALTVGPIANPWRWTTGATADIVAPEITITSPVDGDIAIPVDSTITATFNEEMKQSTMIAANFTVVETLTPANSVTGMVAYDALTNVATFTPLVNLEPSTEYTVTVTTGAQDLASNALVVPAVAGLPVPNPWTFTTAAQLAILPGDVCPVETSPTIPTVTMSDPTNGNQFATTSTMGVVGGGKQISATFDMAMDPTTINDATFTLTPQSGVALVPASVTYDAFTNVATLTTSSALLENTTYEVMITTDVTSAATPGVPLACPYFWTFKTTTPAATGQMPVPLGSASNFVILASAAITNIPTSAITGDVGLTPDSGSNISGFDQPLTCPEVTGTVYAVDAAGPACAVIDPVLIQNAKDDAEIAFLNARAAVRGTPTSISGDLNGLTFAPGLYESLTSLEISPGGALTLDAQGDVNAVFIIRSETTITTQSTSQVILAGGAKANNVYWTAGSSVTLGTNSIMKGTMIAGTSISLLTGANLEGRALNQGAAAESITLDQATITLPLP